jgi:hypothetical protein
MKTIISQLCLIFLLFGVACCNEHRNEKTVPSQEFPLNGFYEYSMYQINELPLRYNPLEHIRLSITGGMGFPSYTLGIIKISESYLVYFKVGKNKKFSSEGQLLGKEDFIYYWTHIVARLEEVKEPSEIKDGIEIYDGISWTIEMSTKEEYTYKSGKVLAFSDVEWIEEIYSFTPYKCDFLLPFKESLQSR